MKIFEKFLNIDRRIIFLLILLGVAIPLIWTLGFNLEVTENVQSVYDLLQELEPGTRILISFDYDPSTKPEIQPMAIALMQQAFTLRLRIIATALWPMGVQMCNEAYETVSAEYPDVEYGIDFINLGYKSGGMVTINHMAKDFRSTFPADAGGNPIDEFPIMKGIKNFDKIGCMISLSAGDPGLKQWVMIVHDTFGKPVAGGTTAVQAPTMLPYVNEQQQLVGLLGGLKGAAEYELLINKPGFATKGMDAQSVAHLIIILFILIGNIGYFATRKLNSKLESK
jgi:hypothetical protein